MAGRLRALRRHAKSRGFDIALSHASHELPLVARSLGIPSAYAFDYEFARTQHRLGCHAARRVVVPDAIPQKRLDRLGASASKVRRYPGLKEEYYLHGFAPDPSVLDGLGLDRWRVLVVVRTPPDVSLYHRHGNPSVRGRAPAARPGSRRAGCRPASYRRATAGNCGSWPAVTRFAGPCRRRPEPGRTLGPCRIRGRNDEPRGGGSWGAGLHDLCGAARRRRRGADRRRTSPAAWCRGGASAREASSRHAAVTGRDPALLLDLMLSALERVARMSRSG